MASSPSFLDPVVLPLIRGSEILDVGCGYGRWGCLLHCNHFEWGLEEFPSIIGLDGDLSNCAHARSLGVYKEVWHRTVPCSLPNKHVDTVLASEIIEHLDFAQIDSLLDSLIACARQRVVVTTPNFECYRGGSISPLGFNELDHHLSHVKRDFLTERGFKVVGAGFHGGLTFQGRVLMKCLRICGLAYTDWWPLNGLSYYWPSLAHTVVAYFDVKG